jgi:hypothetical protein
MLTTTLRGERRTTESTVTHLDGRHTASVYAPRGWKAYTEFGAQADVPQAVS